MPRRPRLSTGGIAYHVLNRRVGRLELFEKPADYFSFEKILAEAHDRTGIRIAAYCLMPNHWHLLLWPRTDGELSEVMRWITVTHSQRWHAHRHSSGTGPVYQGRFKSFPVSDRRAFSCSGEICRTQCSTGEIGRARRRVAMVKHLSDCPTGREAC
ncbi:MAG TPA: transposase [Blastocatellia bacterium]|nr:transposase [Blastocatellia bacterium]